MPFSIGLCREAVSGNYDVVICEGSTNFLMDLVIIPLARLRGMKVYVWDAGRRRNARVTLLRRVADPFFTVLLNMSHGVIAYGSLAKEFLRARVRSKVPVVVAQNAIALTEVGPGDDGASPGIPAVQSNGGPIALYVGGLEVRKKVDILIRAVALAQQDVPELRLLIVGDGPDRERLEGLAEPVQGVLFAGEIIEGVGELFRSSDVYVLPSEGGLGINQAMAWGLPVIATSADGTELDLVKNGETGYLVEEDNITALADAIVTVLRDREEAKAMGRRARAFITQNVTVGNLVQRIVELIRTDTGS